MQLEYSDESLACSVGLQSTPSSAIRATVEGREILSAANGSAAVEDNGDTCVITTWAASVSDVCAGSASWLPASSAAGGTACVPIRRRADYVDKAPTEGRAARAVGEAQRLPAQLNPTVSVRQPKGAGIADT
jgi:hypothetical protein